MRDRKTLLLSGGPQKLVARAVDRRMLLLDEPLKEASLRPFRSDCPKSFSR